MSKEVSTEIKESDGIQTADTKFKPGNKLGQGRKKGSKNFKTVFYGALANLEKLLETHAKGGNNTNTEGDEGYDDRHFIPLNGYVERGTGRHPITIDELSSN